MSQSSVTGYVLTFPIYGLSANEPMSSYRAWENRENLMHLTDEFSQHRVNWMTPDASGYGIEHSGTPDEAPTWSITYPHTWLAPDKPANLDLRVMGHDCYVRARLVPWYVPLIRDGFLNGSGTGPEVFSELLDLSSASPTEDSYLHIVTGIDVATYDSAWVGHWLATGSDGVARRPHVCLMRLELHVLAETAARVFGVCLREFA